MIKKLLCAALAVVLYSCKKSPTLSEQVPATPQEMILGHWVPENKSENKKHKGFEFLPNNICDYKIGFYDFNRFVNDTAKIKIMRFLGTETKYSISNDSLKIYDLENKDWQKYKVSKITADTLIIGNDSTSSTFIKKHYSDKKTDDFDAIVASTSNGSIMLKKDGDITFSGQYKTINKGYCKGKIDSKIFKKIENKFKQADYLSIKYNPNELSSGNPITIAIIKDGQIIHSIIDRRLNNNELYWAYTPLLYLEQGLELHPKQKLLHFLDTGNVHAWYSDGESILELTQAESFYLGEMLQAGRQFDFEFIENHEVGFGGTADRITTDGRYYKFYFKDKTTKTIDIGYNFLTNNLVQKFQKKHE